MITIVITCFNKEFYLNRLLNSLVNNISLNNYQYYKILVIDDCSNYQEKYIDIIKQYKKYFNIQYLKTNKNSGPGVARNLGLNNCNTNFITFIDDDDVVSSDFLKILEEKYDIISTPIYIENKNSYTDSSLLINSVQGIIYKTSFLKEKLKLSFLPISEGLEDSIFRAISFISSENILFLDKEKSFYTRILRTDSNFTRSHNIEYICDNDNIFNDVSVIDDLIWLSLFVKNLSLIEEKQINKNKLYNFLQNYYNSSNLINCSNIILLDYYLIFYYLFNKYFVKEDIKLLKEKNFFNDIFIISLYISKYQNNYIYIFPKNLKYIKDIELNNIFDIFNNQFPQIYNIDFIINKYANFYYKLGPKKCQT